MANPWITHLKKYRAAHKGMSLSAAMKGAKGSYTKKGSKSKVTKAKPAMKKARRTRKKR